MNIDRIVLGFAGSMILLSILFSIYFTTTWLFLTAFVGINLLQSAVTGFCPLAIILKKAGIRPGKAFA